jgi:putative ABC transport system permease protein
MNPTVESPHTSFEETLLSARRTMLLSEILKLAMDSFRAAKTRFVLTALGMVIGTASVILVVTIGMTGRPTSSISSRSSAPTPSRWSMPAAAQPRLERVRYTDYLTREDEKAVDAQLPNVMYSSPVMDMHDRISFGGGVVKDTLVLGVSPQYQNIHNLIVTAGRFFDDTDDHPPEVRRGQRGVRQGALRQHRRRHRPHL